MAEGYVVKTLLVKMKEGVGTLTEYNLAVLSAKFVPSRSVQASTVADGTTIQDVSPTSWALEVSFNTDMAAGKFARFLFDNDGKTGTVELYPNPVTNATLKETATVTLLAGDQDFTVGAFAVGSVSLPVTGKPVITGS
jgi:hypothetical protein